MAPRDKRLDLADDPTPGRLVWVDWRNRHMRGEPGSIRPSIVVSDARLVPTDFDIMTVVPMTGDERIAIPTLSVLIEPTESNGLLKPSYALAFNVQSIARKRIVHATTSAVRQSELAKIRSTVAVWLDLQRGA